MKPFARALRIALRYPLTVVFCWATSLLVAVFWAANLAAVWPVVDAVMHGHSIPQWLQVDVDTQLAELERIDHERWAEAQAMAHASPESVAGHVHAIANLRDQEAYVHERLESVRWVQPIAERWLPDTPFETLGCVCAFILVGTLIKNLFRVANLVLEARLANLVTYDLRKEYFRHLLRLDLAEFSERGRGDLMNRCTSDLNAIGVGVQVVYGQAVREPLKMIACFCGAAWISWRLLLITMVVAPLAAVAVRTLGKSLKRANRRAMEELSGIYETLTETLSSIRVIRTFTREAAERARFRKSLRQLYSRQMKIAFYDSLASPLTENLGVAMVVLAAMAGGYLVLNGETHLLGVRISETPLTHGQMSAFFAMLAGMSDPARRLSGVFNWYQRGSAAAERVFEVLDREPTTVERPDAVAPPSPWKSLRFEGVSFQYTSEKLVLDKIELEVRWGETLAIVGPNGCGKSTLLALPPRLYDPTEGRVTLDGLDLRDLKLRELRERIGVVSQQAQLFNETVAENIALGKPGATQEEIEAAARKAHAHGFITERLAEGYDTLVGPNGGRLSGGQRQRVALARAILRDPELLILDEATSQVDVESERLIHEALAEFTQRRTTLLITHRPSTLALADRVAVMDHGRLVDVGTSDELADRCDLFRRLCCAPLRESA